MTFSVTDGKNSDLAYVSLTLSPLTFQLKKIAHLDGEAPMLYIPQNDADYAACVVDKGIGQFQLHVKTKAPGQYTLDATGMLRGMQIIDLQTGMAVSTPYSFEAGGTSRFLVKLSPDVQKTETSVFAYVSGNHLIVEGTGLLQAYDILGRLLFSRNVNSQLSILNSQFPSAGVYILSLGEKTQKIVIR